MKNIHVLPCGVGESGVPNLVGSKFFEAIAIILISVGKSDTLDLKRVMFNNRF